MDKIITSERVFNSFLKIDKVTLSGNNGTYNIEVVNKKSAIATLCFIETSNEVVLVKQHRVPTNSEIIEVVAGVIENGQNIEETIRREVLEEIGYNVSKVLDLGSYYTSPGFTNEKVHLSISFLGEKVEKGGGLKEENENIEIIKIPLDKFFSMKIEDMKTILLKEISKNIL